MRRWIDNVRKGLLSILEAEHMYVEKYLNKDNIKND